MKDNFISQVFTTNAAFRNMVTHASGSTHAVGTVPCTISNPQKGKSIKKKSN